MRRLAVCIVLALAPLWLVGILGRELWTPDEPREADITWRMGQQSDRTLPQLAGTAFLEKPPLSYWISAGAQALLGYSAPAARAPNLVYAAIATLSIGVLARALGADLAAAIIAALIAGSALTALRVSIWLAPDACLLAGCALALLGAWLGYQAPAGARKAGGYLLMHLGAAIGFMAKSAPGWLVPAVALLTLIVWERRWSELRRWELYAGFALQALIIAPWLLAVARSAHGADALRTLFFSNVVGRFTRVASPAGLDYTSGHHNAPGKYLLELPLYLLPWTLVVAAALRRAWTRARAQDAAGSAWRFAVTASLPFLVLLSLAATARDIYAAPALLGFALLAGLWVHEVRQRPERIDRLTVAATATLVLVIAWLFAGALALLGAAGSISPAMCVAGALLTVAAAHAMRTLAVAAQRQGDLAGSLNWTYAGFACALSVGCIVALPVIDRWQDLPRLARHIHADCAQQSLALLDPDETTIAMLDYRFGASFTIVRSDGSSPPAAVSSWLQARGRDARILVLLPGHAGGNLTRFLSRYHKIAAASDGVAASIESSGAAVIVQRYELPQGRRYALLGPPRSPEKL
ncbi:MAG TPA: glycosyltransferase family 39 protein [Steroidobacteraceae bacterium]|nr:glycosyltransferase family 39 protein [Steroidobacteraceae bacterium]